MSAVLKRKTRKMPIGSCLDCRGPSGGQWLRCYDCRGKFIVKNQDFVMEEPENHYKGERACNLCEETFMSRDRRSNHTCSPCRRAQLQMADHLSDD